MMNILSLLFYIVSFCAAAYLLHIGNIRKSRVVTGIGLIIPILLGGFRYMTGTDYGTYLRNIEWLDGIGPIEYVERFMSFLEPSFYLFAQLANLINYPYLVFFIYSAVTIIFAFLSIKVARTRHDSLIYLLFLLIMYGMSFNLMRQMAAVSIATLAIVYLGNSRPWRALLLTALAALFHVSSLVILVVAPVYLMRNIRTLSLRSWSVVERYVALLAAILSPFLVWGTLLKYGYLLEWDRTTLNLNFFPKALFLAIILAALYRYRDAHKAHGVLILSGVLCVIFGAAGFFIQHADRASLFFMPALIMLLPQAVYLIATPQRRTIATWALIVIGAVYFIGSYWLLGSHGIFPYDSTLTVAKIIEGGVV